VSSSLSKLVLGIHSLSSLDFDLLFKSEDMLLVDKVDEPEVFVELAAVVLDSRLQVGDAHVLLAISIQGAQEGLFGETRHFLRYPTEAFETFRGGRLLELCFRSKTIRVSVGGGNEY
jgi:hypothetical protein